MSNPLIQYLLNQVEDNKSKRPNKKTNDSLFSDETLKEYFTMMEEEMNIPIKEFMHYLPLFVNSLAKNMDKNVLRALGTEFDRRFWYPLTVHVIGSDGSIIYDIPPRGNYTFTLNEREHSNFTGIDNLLENHHAISEGNTYGKETLDRACAKSTVSLGQALAGINLEQRTNINLAQEVEKALIANRDRGVLNIEESNKEVKDEKTTPTNPITLPENQAPDNPQPPSWDAKSLPDIPL